MSNGSGAVETLARRLRRYAEDDSSPLTARVALALSGSDEALRVVATLPARRRQPAFVLAALHDLALAGRAPTLAAAYADGDADAAGGAAVTTLVHAFDEVVDLAGSQRVRADETGRHAVLFPAIAEAARRAGADAVGLIDVGCSAGFNLHVDRVAITYDGSGTLGDTSSPVRVSAAVRGDRPVPTLELPDVVARLGIDPDPVDVTDPDQARWLRACVPPDQADRMALLEAEVATATVDPPLLLRGDAVEMLPDALARVPVGALPVVTTTWALAELSLEDRLRFLHRLDAAAVDRPVAWVSAEGVGVAPAVPTYGDRHASGHSIIGLAVFGHAALRVEAVGRCWSKGRLLAWTGGH